MKRTIIKGALYVLAAIFFINVGFYARDIGEEQGLLQCEGEIKTNTKNAHLWEDGMTADDYFQTGVMAANTSVVMSIMEEAFSDKRVIDEAVDAIFDLDLKPYHFDSRNPNRMEDNVKAIHKFAEVAFEAAVEAGHYPGP